MYMSRSVQTYIQSFPMIKYRPTSRATDRPKEPVMSTYTYTYIYSCYNNCMWIIYTYMYIYIFTRKFIGSNLYVCMYVCLCMYLFNFVLRDQICQSENIKSLNSDNLINQICRKICNLFWWGALLWHDWPHCIRSTSVLLSTLCH